MKAQQHGSKGLCVAIGSFALRRVVGHLIPKLDHVNLSPLALSLSKDD
jgi:hypothetical protein